jgi:membrane fusion protein, multidrug efflux system
MKKSTVLLLSLVFILVICQCGKKDRASQPQPRRESGISTGIKAENKGKQDRELDVDKMNIPERMKEAIKSGRFSKEQVKAFLEKRRRGANFPAVKVEPVKQQPINSVLVFNGTVEPERKVEVYSRLSAYVRKIAREEGDLVKKDDVLALLDDTEIGISYRQAEIQLKQAEFTLKDEEANYQRSQALSKTEMISEQDFQTALANFNKAKLDYQTKLENFKDLELQLSYTRIKSPLEGYITQRLVEEGDRINANQQVFTVEDFSPLLVRVYVPTADIVNLKTGMESEIITDTLSGMVFNGKIKLINPRIDEQSGTVKVTVEVYDRTRQLKPGMFVETRILISNKPNALVVPRKSVGFDQDKPYVFVFDPGTRQVSKRIIKTGISEGDYYEVTGGLQEGERIVTVGVEGLKDQMKVRLANENR